MSTRMECSIRSNGFDVSRIAEEPEEKYSQCLPSARNDARLWIPCIPSENVDASIQTVAHDVLLIQEELSVGMKVDRGTWCR